MSRRGPDSRVNAAGIGVATYAAARIAGALLQSQSLPGAIAQAVVAEYGAGRIGIAWSDPSQDLPSAMTLAKRAAIGGGIGVGAAAMLVAVASLTGGAIFHRADAPLGLFVIGLVTAGLHAMRDELLLRGVPLRVFVGVRNTSLRVGACALTAAAVAIGEGLPARPVIVQAVLASLFAALWVRDRGAWVAWGAHTAWLFSIESVLHGVLETHVASTAWGGGDAGVTGGWAAVVALLPMTWLAVAKSRSAKT